MPDLLEITDHGLYCAAGDFHIDPWRPVQRAIITHAHADHARPGSQAYLTSTEGAGVLRVRLGADARIETAAYGEQRNFNGVRVSLHPAGHLLGSAQVRVEHRGEVWVVSGDYKTDPDPTCTPFELVPCHIFITESTFGLPIYRWPAQASVLAELNAWWRHNQRVGRTTVVYAYALGKAQRVLAGLDPAIGPILVHGAIENLLPPYHAAGIALPAVQKASAETAKATQGGALVLAPPSAAGTPWLRKFGDVADAFVSGWMLIRGTRRRRAVDRGFVLSDHADWDGLISTIRETGAERIGVTHGYVDAMVRWLSENGWQARRLPGRYEGERDDAE